MMCSKSLLGVLFLFADDMALYHTIHSISPYNPIYDVLRAKTTFSALLVEIYGVQTYQRFSTTLASIKHTL